MFSATWVTSSSSKQYLTSLRNESRVQVRLRRRGCYPRCREHGRTSNQASASHEPRQAPRRYRLARRSCDRRFTAENSKGASRHFATGGPTQPESAECLTSTWFLGSAHLASRNRRTLSLPLGPHPASKRTLRPAVLRKVRGLFFPLRR